MQTQTTQLRTLTPAGLEAFLAYFDKIDIRTGQKVDIRREAPPTHLLFDDRYSIQVPFDAEIEVAQPTSKIDLARRVIDALGNQFDAYLTDRHLWAWLTLLWSDVILPGSKDTGWKLGELAQYDIGETKGKNTNYAIYRHRVWGPAVLFKQLGMLSRSMLTGQIHQLGEEIDVLMFRNIATAPVLQAFDLMYFDTEARKIASAEGSNKGRQIGDLRAGTVRDFADQVCQIARTYSIARISPQRLIELLPQAEFGARIKHALTRLSVGDVPPVVPAR